MSANIAGPARPAYISLIASGVQHDVAYRKAMRFGPKVSVPSADEVRARAQRDGWAAELRSAEEAAAGTQAGATRAAWGDAARVSEEQAPPDETAPDSDRPDATRWDRVREEARELAPDCPELGYLLWLDQKCGDVGLGEMSPHWRYTLSELYRSRKRFGIWDDGRGAGKSRSLQRVAGSDSFLVPRVVPPGETWEYLFISVGGNDANRRVRGIAEVYRRALGLMIIGDQDKYDPGKKVKEGVRLTFSPRAAMALQDAADNSILLASIAATIGNVSGPSTIGLIIDEAAKLLDKSEHVNPLTEIIASAIGMFRGRPNIRAIVCSSPMWREGAHYELVEGGDTETNYVARIGDPFVDATIRGFEEVARWEEARGDKRAADQVRAYMRTVSAATRYIPTFTANPTFGNPHHEGVPWDGAAVATRVDVQAIPAGSDKLDGLSHTDYWLREFAAVPMARGSGGTSAVADQIGFCKRVNTELGGGPGAQRYPGLPSWDPRNRGGGRGVL